jgi:hypothetical protein
LPDSPLTEIVCPSGDGVLLQPMWDDWRTSLVCLYCPDCGLLCKPQPALTREQLTARRMQFRVESVRFR